MKPTTLFTFIADMIEPVRLVLRITRFVGEPIFWLFGFRHRNRSIPILLARRVLVTRLDEIGNVILITPFLRELRKNMPRVWITLIVKPEIYNLVEMCPYVDEILTFEPKATGCHKTLTHYFQIVTFAARHLWAKKFDVVVLPVWHLDKGYYGSLLTYVSGAARRVAYSERVHVDKQKGNKGCDRLFTDVILDTTLRHEVERNLEVVKFLGGSVTDDALEVWIDERDIHFAEETLTRHGVKPHDLLVCFCMGASVPRRRWPPERFRQLGMWLHKNYNVRILLLGNSLEKDMGEELSRDLGESVVNIIGMTTLRQATALLKSCVLSIGSDSGLKHIATALRIPVVEISPFGNTSFPMSLNTPQAFKPWKVPHIQLGPKKPDDVCKYGCVSLTPHCILQVTVEEVQAAAQKLLSLS